MIKAVRLPAHALSDRLRAVVELIDSLQTPHNLSLVDVQMDTSIRDGKFVVYAETGPYSIHLNPNGSHPELSLLHEVGHFLEWRAIPKQASGHRDFDSDVRFNEWLDAVLASENIERIIYCMSCTG